jgi:hypothetical protein
MKVKVTKAPLYVWLFDKKAVGWSKEPEINTYFLLQQQAYANEKLKARGYIFLNEVLDMLGLPRCRRGQIVGWIYNKDNLGLGDNFVDFGLVDPHANGIDGAIVLNFNVDGSIIDLI